MVKSHVSQVNISILILCAFLVDPRFASYEWVQHEMRLDMISIRGHRHQPKLFLYGFYDMSV